VSGHISTAEGKKVFALGGKWNEYLDAQRCDEEGNPLPDAEKLHLWKVREWPALTAASTASMHVVGNASEAPLASDAPVSCRCTSVYCRGAGIAYHDMT
jgi:hypothetical protein